MTIGTRTSSFLFFFQRWKMSTHSKLHFNLILLLVDLAFENYAQKYLQCNYWWMFYKKDFYVESKLRDWTRDDLSLSGVETDTGVGRFIFLHLFCRFGSQTNDHVHVWPCMWISVSVFETISFLICESSSGNLQMGLYIVVRSVSNAIFCQRHSVHGELSLSLHVLY